MNTHIGSRFDDFLAEEAMLEETTAVAIKRVVAWQIAQEMKAQHLTKTALAARCIPAGRRSIGCWMRPTPASR